MIRQEADEIIACFRSVSDGASHASRENFLHLLQECLPQLRDDTVREDSLTGMLRSAGLPEEGPIDVAAFINWLFEVGSDAREHAEDLLEGTWTFDGGQFQLTRASSGYTLTYCQSELKLSQEGAWQRGSTWRVRVSNEGNCLMFQSRDGQGPWPPARFASREGCLAKGALLLTTKSAKLFGDDDSCLGIVPAKTKLVAAGATFQDGDGYLMVPISPSGSVQLAYVRLAETFPPEASALRLDTAGNADKDQKCPSADVIWNSLGCEQVVLIKGSWILQHAQSAGTSLPRRQDLPQEAVWEKDTLKSFVDLRIVQLVAVSYCWHTPDHPDPEGFSLRILAQAVDKRLNDRLMPLDDLAVFVDWCSLYQKPRTDEQQTTFKDALSTMHIWYLEADTMVWLLTKTPQDVRPYCDRGWTTFENGVASMVTEGSKLLDLGKLTSNMQSWLEVSRKCAAARQPPLAPEVFVNLLKQKTFTNDSDVHDVAKLYEASFEETMCNAETLAFLDVQWSDEEIMHLALALPYCKILQMLNISSNKFGRQGAEALAAALPQCHSLGELSFNSCRIGDAGIRMLAPALPQMPSLRALYLAGNAIGPQGLEALAEALSGCLKLVVCGLTGNRISPDGDEVAVPALCAAIRQSSTSWTTFYLQRTGLSDDKRGAICNAWVEAGKPRSWLSF